MNNIKILDCTLRDGGYINDWNFGEEKTKIIISLLQKAMLDYIELGFLTVEKSNPNQTLLNSFEKIKKFLPDDFDKKRLLAMITYSKFPLDMVPDVNKSCIEGIRVIFKKNQKNDALKYCKQILKKGYKLFINPTFTDQYSDEELLNLLKDIEAIKPFGVSIVDSMGVMKEKDLLRLYYIIDNNLSRDIALCFHSHNNLQLSFSNAQCLMKICTNRELIIDSTVFGMGRGAGNLCSELIVQYINDNYDGKYNIIPILKIIDEHINPIFAQTPWGYSVPYYLAAINHCHPNYAKYLIDRQTVQVELINKLLSIIPNDKKAGYDANLIKQIYLDNLSKFVDDKIALDKIKKLTNERKILMLAPGKSLESEKEKISYFIQKNNPFIVSLNFDGEIFQPDMVFISNMKRFSTLENINKEIMITSNIGNIPPYATVVNYSSYLNNSEMYDNAALMFLKVLIKINVKEVYIAGLDGFSKNVSENYFDNSLVNNSKFDEIDERNNIMSKVLKSFSRNIKINFITKTKYNIFENFRL